MLFSALHGPNILFAAVSLNVNHVKQTTHKQLLATVETFQSLWVPRQGTN
uniref:Uncharacterized protein n=1 Tax=Arundo donax TaxID=35708 RepID=A0A0A9AKU9_ARUDO